MVFLDEVGPVLAGCPEDMVLECDQDIPPTADVTATDPCDPDPVVSFTEVVDLSECGDYTGTITRTWTATDTCGNTATCTQVITVEDTTDPTFDNCPANVTVECDDIPEVATGITASDNCDNDVSVISGFLEDR